MLVCEGTVRIVFCWLVVILTVAASSAEAAPRQSQGGRALELFEKSARAYSEGRFQDAIDLLLEARTIKKEPVLLYNMGRAYEAIGRPREAADAYAQYLEEEPHAADRGAIEGRIATLRSQADQMETLSEVRPPLRPAESRNQPGQDVAPAPPPRAVPVVVPIVIASVGAVALGTGVGLGFAASARHDDAVADPVQASAHKKQAEAETLATGATITLITGGAMAGIGLAWLTVRAFSPSRNVALLPGIGTLTLKATF